MPATSKITDIHLPFPALPEVVGDFCQAAGCPADRITKSYQQRGVGDVMCNGKQVDLPDHYEAGQHNDHRSFRVAEASECSGKDMIDTVEQQEGCICPQEQHAVFDHCRIRGKESDGRGGKDHEKSRDTAGNEKAQQDGPDGSLISPLFLSCADILADKGGCGHGHALHGQHDKLIQFIIAAPSCHTAGTEIIDIGLHEDVGESGQHRLYGGGKTYRENLFQYLPVYVQVLPDQAVDLTGSRKQGQDQDGRDHLGDDGCVSDAGNPCLERQHKKQVKKDIQNAGQNQEHQRDGSISDSPQNPAADIIDQKSCDSSDIDRQIDHGIVKDILRRGHKAQHRPYSHDSQESKKNA